ncbi:SPOR domain-containing protein [Lysobacter korlensis]|uniref:SPOR domain-containing protein n=1 Tax=Lysobacter korlensis TaxID=553636 RepID=A0ABV6RGZ3_9GAMM
MAKRGKTQARRNQGNGGLPGWAWGVLGVVIGILLILVAPKMLNSDGDGFLRPRPNPDAQPAPVESAGDELGIPEAPVEDVGNDAKAKPEASRKQTDFDFYTLLPGREVPVSDAELAESARIEAEREAKAKAAAAASPAAAETPAAPATTPLPAPVEDTPRPATEPATPAPAPAPAAPPAPTPAPDSADATRYLLQAGAFEASGQAEELKAKIAMLGVGARVESARINGKTVFRVRMGPYGSASELADAKRKLASGGLPAMAIKVE